MTTQADGEGSGTNDIRPGNDRMRDEVEVDRRPDTAGYPSAVDAGAAVDDESIVPTDDHDRAGYPDARDAPEPS
jgi:hypothetical protein